ncbi:MAG: TlpA family protein disulfide reductase [Pirellulales bacterium]|nr:TlpA family protein disulfide reductase [Pirellulales bacterium]
MNSEQLPQRQQSGCAGWFILGLAGFSMAIVLFSLVANKFFDIGDMSATGQSSPAVGKPMPGLDLTPITLNENPLALTDLSGKVTLINFWATWCGPCRAELPEIAELGHEFAENEDFQLLPVSCGDINDDPVQLSGESVMTLREMDLEMPCYSDPTGETQHALAKLTGRSRMSLPTTLVLDREGVVRGCWEGYRPGQGKGMRKLIAELLEEKPGKTTPPFAIPIIRTP